MYSANLVLCLTASKAAILKVSDDCSCGELVKELEYGNIKTPIFIKKNINIKY